MIQTPDVDPGPWLQAGPVAVAFFMVLVVLLGVGWFAREWLKRDAVTRERQEERADNQAAFVQTLATNALASIEQLAQQSIKVNRETVIVLQQIQGQLGEHREETTQAHEVQIKALDRIVRGLEGGIGRAGS